MSQASWGSRERRYEGAVVTTAAATAVLVLFLQSPKGDSQQKWPFGGCYLPVFVAFCLCFARCPLWGLDAEQGQGRQNGVPERQKGSVPSGDALRGAEG